jgi:pilus assembly protein Flp/PilA
MKKLFRDESGATAIEYGLIAGIVSVGIITALTNVKASLNNVFSVIQTGLSSAKVG